MGRCEAATAGVRMLKKVGAAALSLFVAFLLWGFVRNLDRSSASFTIPITWDHPPDILRLPPHPPELEVRVLATKPKLRALQASDFQVRIANNEARVGSELVVLDRDDVGSPFGVLVQEVVPSQFTVSWDRRVERRVPVEVTVVGEPAAGYEIGDAGARSTPPHVRVSGAASRLDDSVVIATEPVDVTGATGSIGPRRVSLIPPSSELRIEQAAEVQATVPIRPRQGRKEIEDVAIEVRRGEWRTTPPNPSGLRVTIVGPEPALLSLKPEAVRLRVDTRGREPRGEDYFLDVEAAIDQDACPGCEVAALSQSKVHVNVKRVPRPVPEDGSSDEAAEDASGGPEAEAERSGSSRTGTPVRPDLPGPPGRTPPREPIEAS